MKTGKIEECLATIAQITYCKDDHIVTVTFVGKRQISEGKLIFWDQYGARHCVCFKELGEDAVKFGYHL
jgi:hypothetical protein